MKNTIKMSLVAALAVAGLSTTASAGGLEEAIKGVSISGKMEVEYDYSKNDSTGATTNTWDLDWDVTAKIPVNDNITAVFGAEGDTNTAINDQDINTDKGADNLQVTKLYFQYANGPVTAMVGKQGMAGAPWYDDERANGVVGIYNAGPVAIAAAHFTGDNGLTKLDDISAAALIAGNIADSGINASLWYADISHVGNSFSLNVNGKVADMVNFDFRHTEVDLDAVSTDNSLTKVVLSADIDAINVRIGYGTTDKDGGLASFEASDDDAATTFGLEQLDIEGSADADAFLIGAGTTIGALSLNVDYIDGEIGTTDISELFFRADYKMSKNFNIGSHYSMAEVGTVDTDKASVSLEYKF